MQTVFIDGQAGTTGLEITQRLASRSDIELLYLDDTERKDRDRRAECVRAADVAILCLKDELAIEAVEFADGQTRIIDASTAFRTHPDWVYGLPELDSDQRAKIAAADYVSNPGCYPQGFILFVRPLIDAGVLTPAQPLRCHAVSGYSGGGRAMIETQENYSEKERDCLNTQLYALSLEHKHVPEMQHYSGTQVTPIFSPTVANYYKGMLVQIAIFESELNGTIREAHSVLKERYADERFIHVHPLHDMSMASGGYLNPTTTNGTNNIELLFFGNDQQLLMVARYDNLGKGAAGAAVQNLNLMLGIEESTSL